MQTRTGTVLLAIGLMGFVICASVYSAAAAAKPSEADKININTAPADELILLRGIGKVNAKKIIEYRDRQGRFKTIEDLMKVPGIGEKTFEKNKDRITVE